MLLSRVGKLVGDAATARELLTDVNDALLNPDAFAHCRRRRTQNLLRGVGIGSLNEQRDACWKT